jgi:hypothetical protein
MAVVCLVVPVADEGGFAFRVLILFVGLSGFSGVEDLGDIGLHAVGPATSSKSCVLIAG